MAKLRGDFSFTGPIGNMSVYKRRDIADPIMRTKGGASKEKIKNAPQFENTRRLNAEFGGRSAASRRVMYALWHLKPLADYNIAGPINALLKHVQALDTEGEYGKRSIELSKNPRLLEGFSLNQKWLFDSVIRQQVSGTILRQEQSARVTIPALVPDINFRPPVNYPMYSIMAVLGVIPDMFYADYGYQPSDNLYRNTGSELEFSAWYPVLKGSPEQTWEIKYPVPPPDEAHSLILGIGIRFGVIKESGNIEQVPYAGSARVLAMA